MEGNSIFGRIGPWYFARVHSHDIGVELDQSFTNTRREARLIAALYDDPMGYLAQRPADRVEIEGGYGNFGILQVGQALQFFQGFPAGQPVGQFADGIKLGAGSKNGECRIAKICAKGKQFAGYGRDQAGPVGAKHGDQNGFCH